MALEEYILQLVNQTLEGHSNNVCSCLFHPRLPIIVSASEDGTVRVWDGAAGAVYPLGSDVNSVALAPRARAGSAL